MFAALLKIVHIVFNDWKFEMLEAYTHRQNIASRALLEKAGFRLLENKIDPNNKNNVVYAISNTALPGSLDML
jgi:[ribosomal protein S5]-alanine N-acetyltransferase